MTFTGSWRRVVVSALWLAVVGAASVLAESSAEEKAEGGDREVTTFLDSIRRGKPALDLRYRYENVAQDSFEKDARASTLRTALGFKTLDWNGLSFLVEAENVASVGNDLYDNGGAGDLWNGVTDRPVVADPALTEINQVYVEYGRAQSTGRLGRVEFNVGDQRFVGSVGWRQNHQSFDALWFENQSLEKADFFYSYLDEVHRVNGATWDTSTHLFNSKVSLGKIRVTPYVYLFDFENPGQFALSSKNLGAEVVGTASAGPTLVDFEAEYADQSEYGNHPGRLDAYYAFLHLRARFDEFLAVSVGYEVLSGSPADGQFNTPLATLHKFNGWADQFLSTPRDGLVDLHLRVAGRVAKIDWGLIWHDFSAETGSSSYGSELDAEIGWTSSWDQRFAFKAAFFESSGHSTDTTKLWLQTSWGI